MIRLHYKCTRNFDFPAPPLWHGLCMDFSVDTIKGSWSGEQDGGRVVDVEYISLHGYIKNTPSDTEVHAQSQLRVDRST